MATIPGKVFMCEMRKQMEGKSNYQCNLDHNAGQSYYWSVYRCEVYGKTFYYAKCCKTANTDMARIKQVCARNK